jgi:glycerophosphoryl diester phosphodiesterase
MKIWEATAEELRQVDIGSHFAAEYSDQRVPTLDEVLTACKGRIGVNIELKYYGHNQALEEKVIEQVEAHSMANEVVVMSLKSEMIDKVKRLRPEWTVGLLTAVAAGDLTRAPADFLAVKQSLATDSFVRSAHGRGKTVAAWTLNDVQSVSMMASRGVDNMITDDPVMARKVKQQRAEMNPLERLSIELAFRFGWYNSSLEMEHRLHTP